MKRSKTWSFILLMGFVTLIPIIIYAEENKEIQTVYNTGKNGLGYASGRDSKIYHYFEKGQGVKLNITYSNASPKSVSTLYKRSNTFQFLDSYAGKISGLKMGENFYTESINESGSYYLTFRGGKPQSKVKIFADLVVK